MLKIPRISKIIRMDWKCSKCGRENTTLRILKGSNQIVLDNNFNELQDGTKANRFEYLNIDRYCICSCGNIEVWNYLCTQDEDEKEKNNIKDDIKTGIVSSRGALGGIVVGGAHGIQKLVHVGKKAAKEQNIKKMNQENLPIITPVNLLTTVEGMETQSDILKATGIANAASETVYNDDQAWDLMVNNLCNDRSEWDYIDYKALIRYMFENDVIDQEQFECLIDEADDAKKNHRAVDFKQFFFEEGEEVSLPTDQEPEAEDMQINSDVADNAWYNMISVLCATNSDWSRWKYASYIDLQKEKNVIDQEQYDCLMEELNDAFNENRPLNFKQFFFEDEASRQ